MLPKALIVNVHSASAARQVKGMLDLSFYYFRETKTRKRTLIWKDWTLNIVHYLEYSPYRHLVLWSMNEMSGC